MGQKACNVTKMKPVPKTGFFLLILCIFSGFLLNIFGRLLLKLDKQLFKKYKNDVQKTTINKFCVNQELGCVSGQMPRGNLFPGLLPPPPPTITP